MGILGFELRVAVHPSVLGILIAVQSLTCARIGVVGVDGNRDWRARGEIFEGESFLVLMELPYVTVDAE